MTNGAGVPERSAAPGHLDELLDQAIEAANRGDLRRAHRLAAEVLSEDETNVDAVELFTASEPTRGELRRLTIIFVDLVASTELSSRQDPETYRRIVGRYKEACRTAIEAYGGYVTRVKGDGMLAVFGYPSAHENDAERGVMAGLKILDATERLSAGTELAVGESIAVRVAVHKGLVYLDTEEPDIYGLAANIAGRLQELARPGSVVISEQVRALVEDRFENQAQEPQRVKGLEQPLIPFLVLQERPALATYRRWATPLVGRNDELETLRRAWRSRPGVVVVVGEARIINGRPGATSRTFSMSPCSHDCLRREGA